MRKTMAFILAAALIAGGFSAKAQAGEGVLSDAGITVTGDTAYYSEYVWRGMLLDGDPVIQPGIYITGPSTGFGKLTAKLWASYDLTNVDARKSQELDSILDYTYDFPSVSVSFGHTYYDFPEQTPTDGAPKAFSREFYAGFSLPKVLLTPSVFVYRDYGRPSDGGGEGTYTVLNGANSIPVAVKGYACSLDMSGHYGINHELFINGRGYDVGLTAGFSVPLTKAMTITPSVNCSMVFGDLKKKSDGAYENRVYTGVTLKYVF